MKKRNTRIIQKSEVNYFQIFSRKYLSIGHPPLTPNRSPLPLASPLFTSPLQFSHYHARLQSTQSGQQVEDNLEVARYFIEEIEPDIAGGRDNYY
jgi:hypothetical protein